MGANGSGQRVKRYNVNSGPENLAKFNCVGDDYVLGHVARHTGLHDIICRQLPSMRKRAGARRTLFERGYADALAGEVSDVAREIWRMHKARPGAFRLAVSTAVSPAFHARLIRMVQADAHRPMRKIETRVLNDALADLAATMRENDDDLRNVSRGTRVA